MISGMKSCTLCQIEKPLEEFYKDKSRGDGTQAKCKLCSKALSARHYRTHKGEYQKRSHRHREAVVEFLLEAKRVTCADCGEWYPHYVLEFDHLSDKSFTIGREARSKSIETLRKEIAKCEIVCANCHSVRTYNRRVSEGKSEFDSCD